MTWLNHLFAVPVTRDQLGTLRAGRWSDPFRPPHYDRASEVLQGKGTRDDPLNQPQKEN